MLLARRRGPEARLRLQLPFHAQLRPQRATARSWLLAVTLTCLTGSGCGKRLEAQECEELLDRYVALLVASDRPGTSETEVLRLKQKTRERALSSPSFSRCSAEVSRAQFECAMQASNVDRLEQCLL